MKDERQRRPAGETKEKEAGFACILKIALTFGKKKAWQRKPVPPAFQAGGKDLKN